MLTNIFYYNFYKPYIISSNDRNSNNPVKRPKIAEKPKNDDTKVLLNKSLKDDVISYAKDVSSSVVGTKNTAKNLVRDMEDFNKNVFKHGYDTAKEWIMEDLEEFVDSYNRAEKFLSRQKHSVSLKQFSERITENITFNSDVLKPAGISINSEGHMAFNKSVFASLDKNAIDITIGESLHLFKNLYEDSSDVLRAPLTEHMKFKGLGYYYNYKMGTIETDTFKIIESGMIIDVEV